MKALISLFFLIGILLWVPAANADVYSWTDENGVKHFGNQPPENAANLKMVFKEEQHDAAADQQRTETQNRQLTDLIRDLEEEERRQAAEAEQNREPTQEEKVAAERERLETKIAALEEKPLEYFGSQKNKRVRIGYYRYRLEALNEDPDKYFSNPSQFEGNVKNPK